MTDNFLNDACANFLIDKENLQRYLLSNLYVTKIHTGRSILITLTLKDEEIATVLITKDDIMELLRC